MITSGTIHRRIMMLFFLALCSSGWCAGWQVANPGIPGVYGSVLAVVNDASGKLYAAGGFTISGDKQANNIALWSPAANAGGGAWTPLGSGTDAEIYALARDKSGLVYAGGYFTTAGGLTADHVAKWNPTTQKWSALGAGTKNGVGGLVKTLACDSSGNLYAGGSFTTAGGASANHIAKWNGTAWVTLGTGTNNGVNNDVNTLAFDAAGNLYVGGWFDTAGGKPAAYLAVWNPKANGGLGAWSALPKQVSNVVNALAFDPAGMLYVGGSFMNVGTLDAYYIAKWNTSTQQWSALGTGYGIYSSVTALACDKSGVLYAGGFFSGVAGLTDAKYIAKWDPAANNNQGAWSSLGQGMDSVVNALSLDSSGKLYAGGTFGSAGSVVADKIAKWTPATQQWSALGKGINNAVHVLAFNARGELYAGGKFRSVIGGVAASRIAKRNTNGEWSALGAGMGRNDTYPPFVETLAFDAAGNLYAGGYFTQAGGVAANNIAKWNGTAWSPLGLGVDARVDAIVIDKSGNVYVGGAFETAGGAPARYIAKWNPAANGGAGAWSALGTGATREGGWGAVYALACDASGKIYAGGRFDSAGGVANTRGLAKWTGTAWTALGSGLTGEDPWVSALLFDKSGNLYAGGKFDSIGGVNSRGPAKWNPKANSGAGAWSMLGGDVSGTYPAIEALAIDNSGNLIIGGRFASYERYGIPTNSPRLAKINLTTLQWSTFATGVDSSNSRWDIQTVLALVCDPGGNLNVGGDFTMVGGKLSPFYAQWGGALSAAQAVWMHDFD